MKVERESDLEDLEEVSSSVVSPGGDRKQRTERADRMAFNAGGMGGFPLTRLNDSNYKTWAVKDEMLLRREGIWQFVNNNPAQFDEEQERDHEKALRTLVLSIEDNQLIHIQGLTTAKAVWDRLKNIYIRETAGIKIH